MTVTLQQIIDLPIGQTLSFGSWFGFVHAAYVRTKFCAGLMQRVGSGSLWDFWLQPDFGGEVAYFRILVERKHKK
jgi:hypothetical protein